jgi:hypothetical protein
MSLVVSSYLIEKHIFPSGNTINRVFGESAGVALCRGKQKRRRIAAPFK